MSTVTEEILRPMQKWARWQPRKPKWQGFTGRCRFLKYTRKPLALQSFQCEAFIMSSAINPIVIQVNTFRRNNVISASLRFLRRWMFTGIQRWKDVLQYLCNIMTFLRSGHGSLSTLCAHGFVLIYMYQFINVIYCFKEMPNCQETGSK